MKKDIIKVIDIPVLNSVWYSVEEAVEEAVYNSVYNSVEDYIQNSVRYSVWNNVAWGQPGVQGRIGSIDFMTHEAIQSYSFK